MNFKNVKNGVWKIQKIYRRWFTIARYTIDIDYDLAKKLNDYMKENNIKLRSIAIKRCIEDATSKENFKSALYEFDKKLNRILHRQSLSKKILEQLFSNMGFTENLDSKKDELLNEIYDEYSKKYFGG